jgi:hypothetical protein
MIILQQDASSSYPWKSACDSLEDYAALTKENRPVSEVAADMMICLHTEKQEKT